MAFSNRSPQLHKSTDSTENLGVEDVADPENWPTISYESTSSQNDRDNAENTFEEAEHFFIDEEHVVEFDGDGDVERHERCGF